LRLIVTLAPSGLTLYVADSRTGSDALLGSKISEILALANDLPSTVLPPPTRIGAVMEMDSFVPPMLRTRDFGEPCT